MALTKEKLISRLQTQVGLSKQESRSVVERVLDIMKESLAEERGPAHQRLWKIFGEAKERPPRPEPANQGKSDPQGPPGSGVQDLRRPAQPHQRRQVTSSASHLSPCS